MAETETGSGARQRLAAPRNDRFGAALFALSEALAVFGGIVLIVMTAFTVISVVGRTGFDLPVLGDQEIVELGCAIAIFSFMPYCQMRAANVIVDFFTARLSQAARDGLDATMNAIFSVCILIVTWRLAVGGIATYHASDASMFLRIPQWWGYGLAFIGCIAWSLACLYSMLRSIGHMRESRRAGGAAS
ncbi:MAG: TRAP transporter small permease [Defluviicoccus sp.]|nr:TRAP transporter small permease [Defluviicoccus sp.]MDE0385915.1 TRAP transporter small permease [Defluviicoccus sp.]